MSSQTAIIAALPREISALVRGTKPDATLLRQGIHLHRLPGAVVVAAGMGATRATLAVQAALATGDIGKLISVGLAGACQPQVPAGAVIEANEIIDACTGERYTTSVANASAVLVTTDAIAGIHEKARLAATYGALMVDMEAAIVARLALANSLSFRAIKAISDAHDFELASLSRFASPHGHFRTGAFALHTMLRPHHWHNAVHLGRNSNRALAALTKRLCEVITR